MKAEHAQSATPYYHRLRTGAGNDAVGNGQRVTAARSFFNACADTLIRLLGLNRPTRITRAFLDRIDVVNKVVLNGTTMVFDANHELHLLRSRLIGTKEPETIAWIDTFSPDAVFFDIGANIGVFTLYAALHRNCDVYAFEPEAKNYACLNRNLLLNGLGRRVKALNVGLHDSTCIEFLQLHDLSSGAALHALGEPIDWRGERFEPRFEQAVLAFGLDDFVQRLGTPSPNYIKLDVDGNEEKIIRGGRRTFSDPAMKSLMIEINENNRALAELIESCGLHLTHRTRAAMQGAHSDTYNAVFSRV